MKNKILPVFISFAGCTSRCIYCNQHKITGVKPTGIITSAQKQIEECLGLDVAWTELAFYGGSFTCLSKELRLELYALAEKSGIKKLRFSTSPDCIDKEVLVEAVENGVETIELGVQSLSDDVLKENKRPYTSKECIKAFEAVKDSGVKSGIQLMVGMYNEGAQSFYETVDKAVEMRADYARIYPTVVLGDTELAEMWKSGRYTPLNLWEAVARSTYGYIILTASGCDVIRIGLQDSVSVKENALAGSYHPAMGEMVKTVAMQTYLNLTESISIGQEYINITYGYAGILKDLCKEKVKIKAGERPDFGYICREIVRLLGEDYKRKLQEQTACYAKRLVDKTNN